MWKLTEWGASRYGLPGVPWRDLTDEEFAAAEALHPEIRERGYFEETDDLPVEPGEGGTVESTPDSEIPGVLESTNDEDAPAADEVIGGRPRRTRVAPPESEATA